MFQGSGWDRASFDVGYFRFVRRGGSLRPTGKATEDGVIFEHFRWGRGRGDDDELCESTLACGRGLDTGPLARRVAWGESHLIAPLLGCSVVGSMRASF